MNVVKQVLTIAMVMLGFAQAAAADGERHECIMDPAQLVRLAAINSGVISDIFVRRGDRVEEGQPVAQMNASLEQATISILEARLASTAQIEAQEARVNFTAAQLDRVRRLVDQSAQSAVRLEEIQYEHDIALAQLAQARNDRTTLLAELQRAQIAYENTIIKSPVDGVVLDVSLSAGEHAGQDRHIMVIARLDPLHVEAFLPIQLYSEVHEGMDVTIYPDEPLGGRYPARISVMDSVFDTASRTFGVRAELANPDSEIPGGYRCRLEIDFSG